MKLLEYIRRWSSSHPGLRGRALGPLPSPARMAEHLRRERALSDRHGEPLSILVLAPGYPEVDAARASRLVQALRGRLRASDALGWLDARRLLVVLPSTPYEGACKLVRDLCRAAEFREPPLAIRIRTHRGLGDGSGWGRHAAGPRAEAR